MSVALVFKLSIEGWGGGFSGSAYSVLSLGAQPGPDRVRVDWGAADFLGREAAVVSYLPQPDGSFSLPGPGTNHAYGDGSYTIRAVASTGATREVDLLNVFVDVNNAAGMAKIGTGMNDVMFGGAGADSFSGGNGNDLLASGDGDDLLAGGNGNDIVSSGNGDDTGNGGNGDDLIFGDAGNDSLMGGAGSDTLNGGVDQDVLNGGDGDDRLWGDDGAFGGGPDGGDDTLIGGFGNDSLDGEIGNDSLNGGTGNDDLTGGEGNDTAVAGDGDDYLYGNAGDDRLIGGSGSDSMYGGIGSDYLISQADGAFDLFTFLAADEGTDRIVGFEAGIDKLFLNFIIGSTIDATHFVGTPGAMTDTATYIIYNAVNGQLRVDIDGTGGDPSALLAVLVGMPALSFGDFWFGSFD